MQPSPALGDVVDIGSWTRFSPSLAAFIDEQVRLHRLPGGLEEGMTVRLTAPAPVVTDRDPAAHGRLRLPWRRRPPRVPSSETPGVVLTGKGDEVEVALPVLDAAGRVLLGDDACAQLTVLGWTR